MSKIQLFESDIVTVEYWSDKKLIYHTIHKPVVEHPQSFKDAVNAGTEALKKYSVYKWLSDDRNNGPLPQEIIEFAFQDWTPRTIEAGWKYWANIVPADLVAAGTLTPIISDLAKYGLRMMVFTTPEQGIDWLDKMK